MNEAVTSLRRRAQADSEARVREVEAENRALHQSISETGGRLARLEAEQRQATKELETLRERAERCDELERDISRVERAREQLERTVRGQRGGCGTGSSYGWVAVGDSIFLFMSSQVRFIYSVFTDPKAAQSFACVFGCPCVCLFWLHMS